MIWFGLGNKLLDNPDQSSSEERYWSQDLDDMGQQCDRCFGLLLIPTSIACRPSFENFIDRRGCFEVVLQNHDCRVVDCQRKRRVWREDLLMEGDDSCTSQEIFALDSK